MNILICSTVKQIIQLLTYCAKTNFKAEHIAPDPNDKIPCATSEWRCSWATCATSEWHCSWATGCVEGLPLYHNRHQKIKYRAVPRQGVCQSTHILKLVTMALHIMERTFSLWRTQDQVMADESIKIANQWRNSFFWLWIPKTAKHHLCRVQIMGSLR